MAKKKSSSRKDNSDPVPLVSDNSPVPGNTSNLDSRFALITEKLASAAILADKHLYRDAFSRLYYAFFHMIGACLKEKNVDLSNHKHSYILMEFRRHFIDSGIFPQKMYILINQLKNFRESADYGLDFTASETDYQNILVLLKKQLKK